MSLQLDFFFKKLPEGGVDGAACLIGSGGASDGVDAGGLGSSFSSFGAADSELPVAAKIMIILDKIVKSDN